MFAHDDCASTATAHHLVTLTPCIVAAPERRDLRILTESGCAAGFSRVFDIKVFREEIHVAKRLAAAVKRARQTRCLAAFSPIHMQAHIASLEEK